MSHTSQTSGHDAFAATFRHDGEFRCVWLFDAGNLVDAEDAVVLDDGSVVVVGQFEDAVDLLDAEGGVATHLTAAGDTYDGFIVRYAPASEP